MANAEVRDRGRPIDTRLPIQGRPEQIATRVIFFVLGLGMAAWAPLIPFVKQRTGIPENSIGFLLLCLGLGSIMAMPVAGALAHKFGCRAILLFCGALICAALPILACSSSLQCQAFTGCSVSGASLVREVRWSSGQRR